MNFDLLLDFGEMTLDDEVGEAPNHSKMQQLQPPRCQLLVACLGHKGEFPTDDHVQGVEFCWFFDKQKLPGGRCLLVDSHDWAWIFTRVSLQSCTLAQNFCLDTLHIRDCQSQYR